MVQAEHMQRRHARVRAAPHQIVRFTAGKKEHIL
jgi:hypothetical protein